jgi:hypothetical protein
VTVGELPNIVGRIMNICAQDKNVGVSSDGVFSSFSNGSAGRPSASTYDAKADSVNLNFGDDKYHNNVSACIAAYVWQRTA